MAKTKISTKTLTELNRQINCELTAAHDYLALSVWCAYQNLKGFAGFFAKQVDEEREHAEKMMKHVLDRGLAPELAAIAAPKQNFKSLLEVAVAAKDYPAQVLMHWFIKEQVEEEAWAAELVDRVRAATCAGSLMDLDRHIEKLLGDKKED
jgi:ferritin